MKSFKWAASVLITFVGICVVLPKFMPLILKTPPPSKLVDERFRNALKGHIVFTRRNSKKDLEVCRIVANGKNETLLC